MTRPSAPTDSEADEPRLERRNLVVFLLHGLLGMTGFRLIQAPTFLPAYVSILTGSSAAVGAARAVQSLGMFLSPLIGASLLEARPRAKRLALVFGFATRLQILILAILAFTASERVAGTALWLVLFAWGLCNGLQGVTFNELIAKIVPVRSRGRLVGLRNLSAGLSLLLVSAVAGWILDAQGYPRGYAWTFLLSFTLATIGLLCLAFLREEAHELPRVPIGLRRRLQDVPVLLRSDRAFARYVAARLLATAAGGALPFYVLWIGARFGLSGSRLAGLTVAYTLAQSLSALPWGMLGDRFGYRIVFLGGQTVWMVGTLTALRAEIPQAGYLAFLAVGCGLSGTLIAQQNLALEFGDARDRPLRIAIGNSLAEALGALGFLTGGLIAQSWSMAHVFVASMTLQALALGLALRLEDPRSTDPSAGNARKQGRETPQR